MSKYYLPPKDKKAIRKAYIRELLKKMIAGEATRKDIHNYKKYSLLIDYKGLKGVVANSKAAFFATSRKWLKWPKIKKLEKK